MGRTPPALTAVWFQLRGDGRAESEMALDNVQNDWLPNPGSHIVVLQLTHNFDNHSPVIRGDFKCTMFK